MKRIYLAGPEVFLDNAIEIGENKKKLCELYGFKGVFPLDNTIDLTSNIPQENGLEIAAANERLIASSHYVIANITPFRGTSCDVGTAYEMGLARGLGKPVFAYTNDSRLFLERNLSDLCGSRRVAEHCYVDANGMTLENFGLVDNLMLDGSVSDNIIINRLVEEDQPYRELLGFEQCLKQINKFQRNF